MGEYIVSNSVLRSTIESYDQKAEELSEKFKSLSTAVNNFCQSSCFRGNAADTIKGYMSGTYSNTIYMLSSTVVMIAQCFAAYANKYFDLDGSYKALIPTQKLMDVCEFLRKEQDAIRQANDEFRSQSSALLSSGDMKMSYEYSAGESTAEYYDTMITKIQGWYDRIHTIEEAEISSEFGEMDALMDKLESLLTFQKRSDPQNFNVGAYQAQMNSCSSAFVTLAGKTDAKSKQVESAHEAIGKMEEAEKEDRRKETAWITGLVDVGCAIATGVATVAFGPVGNIVVGGITGAVKSAVHEGVDQYVEHGEIKSWGKIAIKGVIGGATGAGKAAVGQVFKGLGGKFNNDLLGKTMDKIGLNAGEKLANTLIDHTGAAAEKFLVGKLIDGKSWGEAWDDAGEAFRSNLKKDLVTSVTSSLTSGMLDYKLGGMADGLGKSAAKVLGKAVVAGTDYTIDCALDPEKDFNAREMLAKSGQAAFTATVSEAGDALGKATGYSQWVNDEKSNKAGRYVMNFVVGGTENVITQNGGAAVETFIRTGDSGAAVQALKEDAIKNFAQGGNSAVIKQYGEEHFSKGKTKTLEEQKDEAGNVVYKKERVYYEDGRSMIRETNVTITQNEETGTTTTVENRTYSERGKKIGWGQTVTENKEKALVDAGQHYKEVTSEDHYTAGNRERVESYRTGGEYIERGTGRVVSTDDRYDFREDRHGTLTREHTDTRDWNDSKGEENKQAGYSRVKKESTTSSWNGQSRTVSESESTENRFANGTAHKESVSQSTRYYGDENRGYTREESIQNRNRVTGAVTTDTDRWNQERSRTIGGYRRETDDYSHSSTYRGPGSEDRHVREKTTYTVEQHDVWKENRETGSDEHVNRSYRRPRSEYKP